MSHRHALIHLGESCRAGQRKMFLVRLCYADLTQGLPDFTAHASGPAPRYKEWSGCTVVTQTSPARGYGGAL